MARFFNAVSRRLKNLMTTDGTGFLIRYHREEIFALDRTEETRFCPAVSMIYDDGVDGGGEEGDTVIWNQRTNSNKIGEWPLWRRDVGNAGNSQQHQSLHKPLEEDKRQPRPFLCLHSPEHYQIIDRDRKKHQPIGHLDKLQDQICQWMEPGGDI